MLKQNDFNAWFNKDSNYHKTALQGKGNQGCLHSQKPYKTNGFFGFPIGWRSRGHVVLVIESFRCRNRFDAAVKEASDWKEG